jgi:hypothetical protein
MGDIPFYTEKNKQKDQDQRREINLQRNGCQHMEYEQEQETDGNEY